MSSNDRVHTLRTAAAALVAASLAFSAACATPPSAQGSASARPSAAATATATPSFKDVTITVEGRTIALVNGAAETELAPGSASKAVTRFFGNEATGDLNADGQADTAFVITQSSGGSGTFFYVVVALRMGASFVGTNAVLLGDRIAPQTTEIRSGELIVNYADRKPGEPMTATPSVAVSKFLKVVGRSLQPSR